MVCVLPPYVSWVYFIRLNHPISGKCSFLDAQFRDIPRSIISAHRGSKLLVACIHMILRPRWRYSLWTYLITLSMFFSFPFLTILPVANIMRWDMVFRNPIPFMCMRSQHRVTFFCIYQGRPWGRFILWWVPHIGYCSGLFFLTNMAHWVHRCPHLSLHLLAKLGYFVGYCYQPHVIFSILVGLWCSGIAMLNQTSLHCGKCIVSSFPPLVLLRTRNHSPWCAHSSYFWEGESCRGRIDRPWSYWM